jgi:TP901-1 family phage major tail protein
VKTPDIFGAFAPEIPGKRKRGTRIDLASPIHTEPRGIMAAQPGKNLLLKLQDATGGFGSVAGLRSRALVFNAQAIDTTHQESIGWRELLAAGGIRSAHIAGAGIFKDAASDALIRTALFAGELRRWQIVIPDFGIVEGPFQITALTFTAAHDAEVAFDLTLVSAGPLMFTAI